MAGGFFDDLAFEAGLAARAIGDAAGNLLEPKIRLGVTGLSRAGKTVFITALVHALTAGGRFPVLTAMAEGRVAGAELAPQPDDNVPRFAYEAHLDAFLGAERHWPHSTRAIAELRLVIDYETKTGWRRGPKRLTLDLVDYPGEWLLDLPLLKQDYATWSRHTIAACRTPQRLKHAAAFLAAVEHAAGQPADEIEAQRIAGLFRQSLIDMRDDPAIIARLAPGHFLMQGEREGAPALTFAPMPVEGDLKSGTLAAMMARRYDAYRDHVVKPFFRDHFARLDRQIVLVDVLYALNGGSDAVADLRVALDDILGAFRTGADSFWTDWFRPKIDRVLFAATKADHLNSSSHDRLEAILRLIVERSMRRIGDSGARIDVIALASVRATREADVRDGNAVLPAIAGVPLKGEIIGDVVFDGVREAVIFPGDLPAKPEQAIDSEFPKGSMQFVRFRPPLIEAQDRAFPLPHIRLDRALEFLIGDQLP